MSASIPKNKKLYEKIKKIAKKKFKVWPSAYASGWVVKTYKDLGGEWKTIEKPSSKPSSKPSPKSSPLRRWYMEKWVNVCKLPKIVPCGRNNMEDVAYPYCRPLNRITSKTPKTVKEIPYSKLKSKCRSKRRNPHKKQSKI
jgi:hypothetical protein